MNKVKNDKKGSHLNGNNILKGSSKRKTNGICPSVKDQITTDDGRVFYPCRFCNKVFPIKKTRTAHMKNCPAKEYILSVGDSSVPLHDSKSMKKILEPTPKKINRIIDIQQEIVLSSKEIEINEVTSKPKSPPIKLTIRRSTNNNFPNHFTVSNSLVLKEKNESNDDFNSIAKRLENNSVTIIKQPKVDNISEVNVREVAEEKSENNVNIEVGEDKLENDETTCSDESDDNEEKPESNETSCKECSMDFNSSLELLRHSRSFHSYPKVLMALSEVKKFYSAKVRSKCPICHKPLKTNFRSAFIKHLHTHTNEMKYSCTICKRKFRRFDHMKVHEKRHVVKKEK